MNLGFKSNRNILVIFLSLIILIGMFVFSNNLFNASIAKKDYTVLDANIKGYEIKDNQLISTTGDSQIEFGSQKLFLSSLQLIMDKPLEQDSLITIYYNTGKGYSENEKVNIPLKKGCIRNQFNNNK